MTRAELFVLYAPPLILVVCGGMAAFGNHVMVKRARDRDRKAADADQAHKNAEILGLIRSDRRDVRREVDERAAS